MPFGFQGEDHPGAKLTEKQVFAIMEDPRPHKAIAEQYNVSQPHVSLIKLGKTWRHLTGGEASDRRGSGCRINPKGEQNRMARLTESSVRAIRKDRRKLKAIAADYGVTMSTVWLIRKRKIWTHVPEEPANDNGDAGKLKKAG
jgi:hypothetical protein